MLTRIGQAMSCEPGDDFTLHGGDFYCILQLDVGYLNASYSNTSDNQTHQITEHGVPRISPRIMHSELLCTCTARCNVKF